MSNAAPVRQAFVSHMDQSLEHLRKDLRSANWASVRRAARWDSCRLLRHHDPAQTDCQCLDPGSSIDYHQPWEPQLIKEIEKGIANAGLGVTPSNDGKIIRVPLPPLTERRKELTKICKKHGEDAKVQLRGFRREANEELKKLQKDAKLTEDELRKAEQETQKLIEQYGQKVDDIIKKKEQEIMEV